MRVQELSYQGLTRAVFCVAKAQDAKHAAKQRVSDLYVIKPTLHTHGRTYVHVHAHNMYMCYCFLDVAVLLFLFAEEPNELTDVQVQAAAEPGKSTEKPDATSAAGTPEVPGPETPTPDTSAHDSPTPDTRTP